MVNQPALELTFEKTSKEAVRDSLIKQVDRLTSELETTVEQIQQITCEIEQIEDQIDTIPSDQDAAAPLILTPTQSAAELQPESHEGEE